MIGIIRKAVLAIAFLSIPMAVSAAPQVYELTVDGLACPFCAYGIEKQLSALEGVKSIEVEIDEGLVVVTMSEGKTLDRADIDQAIMDAGFTLRNVQRVRIDRGEIEKGDG